MLTLIILALWATGTLAYPWIMLDRQVQLLSRCISPEQEYDAKQFGYTIVVPEGYCILPHRIFPDDTSIQIVPKGFYGAWNEYAKGSITSASRASFLFEPKTDKRNAEALIGVLRAGGFLTRATTSVRMNPHGLTVSEVYDATGIEEGKSFDWAFIDHPNGAYTLTILSPHTEDRALFEQLIDRLALSQERGAALGTPCADCNVIIVGLDALGASHVSHLGYATVTTPTLDSMAKTGVSFSNAISPSSWTVPSFMSVFTGMYPTEHKVVNKFSTFTKDQQIVSNLRALSPEVVTLAEVFAQNGYTTGGFTGDAGVGAAFGYNQGFATYTDETTFGSIGNASVHALPWITQHKDEKLFIFLHGYDNHGQYALPDGYQGRFMPKGYAGSYKGTKAEQGKLREQGLADGHIALTPEDVSFWRGWYDSKIHDTDARFAEFWKQYNALGITRKTVVVLLADHGTEFYEHGRFDHGFTLYDELVRVPLVFVVPGLPAQPVVDAEVTTLDVAPTLLAITGATPNPQFAAQQRGRSLLPFLQGSGGASEDVYIETDYRDFTHKRGIRTADGWKYVLTMETGDEELYQLSTDPHEQMNVTTRYPDMATELKIRVITHMREMGTNPEGPWKTGCVPVYGDQCK